MYTSMSDGRHDATVYSAAVDAEGIVSMLLACRRRAPSMDPSSKYAAPNICSSSAVGSVAASLATEAETSVPPLCPESLGAGVDAMRTASQQP